ncbi:MAG TPA: ABC transporter ATP-binding protein [Trueperaceae bacterium]|nr:ABC transporter ATP-binding protein [Trueperaceae bacterium]
MDRPSGSGARRGAVRRLAALLAPYRWQVVWLSLVIAAGALVSQVAPQFARIVIDVAIPRGTSRIFLLLALAMAGYYLLREVLSFVSMYFSYALTQRVIHDLRRTAYAHLLRLPMARFTRERSGSLVARVVSDVNALESMIQAGASRILGRLFGIVVVLVILFVMNWLLALVCLAIVAAMVMITLRYQEPLRQLSRRIRSQVGELTGIASEAIQNAGVVKLFTAEEEELGRFADASEGYRDYGIARRLQSGMMQAGVGLSSGFGTGALLLLGGWLIVLKQTGAPLPLGVGGLSTGELTAFLLYVSELVTPVVFVLNFNNQLQAGAAAIERIDELLAETPEVGGREARPAAAGDLRFEGVTFRYPGSQARALDGFDLTVPFGATVALVGPSGAGKSTVVKLLGRLYDPEGGAILLGGRDLRRLELGALRGALAVVPQDPTLFSGSARDNIRYARPDADDAAVTEAARLANALDFITALPRGFDTEVGERGVKLSGGQKQRIAIARALLRGATLLVLDEATSSLDSESEAVIQDALAGLFTRRREVTSLVIAHRLSTVRNADRIAVMDRGHVVELGDHAALLAQGGLYARLHAIQQQGGTDGEDPELLEHHG